MKTQITHISIHQTSKVVALMYFFFMLLFVPVGIAFLAFVPADPQQPQQRLMGIFFLFAPVLYAVVGYLGFALASLLYNALAKRVGGIEFDTAEQLRVEAT
jgi:ABC-type Na+ efflux pump permease subunit